MNKYELLLTLPGTLDDNEVQEQANGVVELVNSYGQGAKLKEIGKMRLAYPIKQIRYGYFYTIIFESETDKIQDLNDKLRLHKELLRAIINKYNSNFNYSKKEAVKSIQKIEEAVEEKIDVQEIKRPENVDVPTLLAKPVSEDKKVDLEDIDRKLDEILDDSLITGV